MKPATDTKAREISLDEAFQIFDVESADKIDVEALKKKWTVLKKNNDLEKGGSPYLYHKIKNAIERIAKHLKVKTGELETVEEKEEPKDEKKEEPKDEKKEEPKDEKKEVKDK